MSTVNASRAIKMSGPLLVLLAAGCTSAINQPGPGERPAEIVLPPTRTAGNLDKIRSDLAGFASGKEHKHTRPATCRNCVVETTVRSVGLTTDIEPIRGPRHFRVIGLIKNTDLRDTEGPYSLKPNTEYLMWVDSAAFNKEANSRTRWGLLELPSGSTGELKPRVIGYVKHCDGHRKLTWYSDTDFKSCEKAAAAHSTVGYRAAFLSAPSGAVTSRGPKRAIEAPDLWFDCGGYCCSAPY